MAADQPIPPGHPLRHYGAKLVTLRRRAEFQRLRGGVRWSGAAFLMEGKPGLATPSIASTDTSAPTRFGFTITKKIGEAHERNRMRRRLSHALRLVQVPPTLAGWDCVIIARRPAMTLPFDTLVRDFTTALARLARGQPPSHKRTAPPPEPPNA